VQVVLAGGTDANAKDEYGRTALQRAIDDGNADIVQAPLDGGADANAENNDGLSAKSILAILGGTATIIFLLLIFN
jgi:ankyrin repeat protein